MGDMAGNETIVQLYNNLTGDVDVFFLENYG
jgi:hypothetical protein